MQLDAHWIKLNRIENLISYSDLSSEGGGHEAEDHEYDRPHRLGGGPGTSSEL